MLCGFAVTAKNFVAFVNVDSAVSLDLLHSIVTNDLRAIISVDGRVHSEPTISIADLVNTTAKGYPSGNRQLSVYLVNSTNFPPQVVIPQYISIINVRGLNKNSTEKLYRERIRKVILKGLAFSCGFGATMESGTCVMGLGSFDSLKGIDETSDSYSPFCFFPLEKYLNQRKLMWIDPAFE